MAPIHHLMNGDSSKLTQNSENNSKPLVKLNGQNKNSCCSLEKQFPEIDKNELTRLLIQALSDLGYQNSSRALKDESGLDLDSPVIHEFTTYIKNGDLQRAETTLQQLDLLDDSEAVKEKIRFLMKREKFLECLYLEDSKSNALEVLRNELNGIAGLSDIKSLSGLLLDKDNEKLQQDNGWVGTTVEDSRNFLLTEVSKFINPRDMIPKNRLFKLIQQSIEYQKSINLYSFNDENEKVSLYEDMKSSRKNFPDKIIKEIADHTDEAWFVTFSHDGSKLVSTSKDQTARIYDVHNNFKHLRTLSAHEAPVMYASFSPNNTQLVTCGLNGNALLWDLESESQEPKLKFDLHCERTWCLEWTPDGKEIVLASPDKCIGVFDSSTGMLLRKCGAKVINDLALTPDKKLIAATYNKSVEVYDLDTLTKIKTLDIGTIVSCVAVSEVNPDHILINTIPDEIHLWDWKKNVMLNRYIGHSQEQFIVRSCFGYNEQLVASGSEDGRLFFWNKEYGALLGACDAHAPGTNVNTVTSNPKDKPMFASCGDDRLVKIWAPANRLQS